MPQVSIILHCLAQNDADAALFEALAETAKDIPLEIIAPESVTGSSHLPDAPNISLRPLECGEPETGESGFAKMANLAAREAKGEYLLFLSATLLPLPGWLPPLLADFAEFPNLAATGGSALQEGPTVVGRLVCNLGLCVTPGLALAKLYENIPQASPLSQKRRFFQVISGDCLMISRKLFLEAGGFDEKYKSALASADLCARLCGMGYRCTINPGSQFMLANAGPENPIHQRQDLRLFRAGNGKLLKPDWQEKLNADGLELALSEWQAMQPGLPKPVGARLDSLLARLDSEKLLELLIQNPYWQNGWKELAGKLENNESLILYVYNLFNEPEFILKNCAAELDAKRTESAIRWLARFSPFARTYKAYVKQAQSERDWLQGQGEEEFAQKYEKWLADSEVFKMAALDAELGFFLQFNQFLRLVNSPHEKPIYAAWLETIALPIRKKFLGSKRGLLAQGPGITLLMLAENPRVEWLIQAINSLLSQEYEKWELLLLLTGESGKNGGLPGIPQDLLADARIRLINTGKSDAAEALNIGLQDANYPWTGIIDEFGMLAKDALALFACAIRKTPRARLFYSDEDYIDDKLIQSGAYFKSDWNPVLSPLQNYLHRLTLYNTARAKTLRFRGEFGDALEYDFNLRYCRSLAPGDIYHLCQPLYHCQADARQEIVGINAGAGLAENARRALQDYLAMAVPGAVANLKENNLLHISWPDAGLKIAVICEMAGAAKEDIAAFCEKWSEADEILLPGAKAGNYGKKAIPLAPPQNMDAIERLNWAATQAKSAIIGFTAKEVVPAKPGWKREFAGFAANYPAGAWAGKITIAGESLLHGGYLGDCFGNLRPIFFNAPLRQNWFNWQNLSRNALALGGECLFTQSGVFHKNGGLDASCGKWAFQDYCLRLEKQGLMNAWLADAGFELTRGIDLPLETDGFIRKWYGDFPAFNENLIIVGKDLSLTRFPTILGNTLEDSREFSRREYCQLYFCNGNLSGQEPVEHYLSFMKEGSLKSRRSRIDYSGHTKALREKYANTPKSGIVVVTALTGAYEKLLPPAFVNMDWQYVCYTDQPREDWGIWEMREIPWQHENPRRRARWIKTNLPKLFPEATRVLWIDANIIITSDLAPVIAAREDCALALVDHPGRDCAYEEGEICISTEKDRADLIEAQLARYRAEGLPEHTGLYETNIMLLDPKSEMVKLIFAEWSAEIMANSLRDQISLPYVLFKNGYTPCNLLWKGQNMRNYKGCEYLMHQETAWIVEPRK